MFIIYTTQQKHGNAHTQINHSYVACFTQRHIIVWDKYEVHIIGHENDNKCAYDARISPVVSVIVGPSVDKMVTQHKSISMVIVFLYSVNKQSAAVITEIFPGANVYHWQMTS